MKNLLHTTLKLSAFLLAFVVFGHHQAFAKDNTSEKSLLWKIEGNSLTQPSYLFGTVHMICQDQFKMTDKVKKALAETSQTYLEIDLSNPNMQAEAMKYMMASQPTSSLVTAEDAKYIDSTLKVKLGAGLDRLDNIKPMILIAGIVQQSFPCPLASFEGEIIKLTKEKSHKTYGLSTVEEQYSFLEKAMKTEKFAEYLREMLAIDISEFFDKIFGFYKDEDLHAINQIMEEFSTNDTEMYHQLMNVRNKLWVGRIPEIIKNTPTFIGVGTGHLKGQEGMIQLLRDKGYTVTPVF